MILIRDRDNAPMLALITTDLHATGAALCVKI
jgi:hypothetical protein